ncbi:hypothetical protein TCAL_07586 [Tigriopus californicus]|uniref:Ig-like domain-containing protein n=1 Tax=Tigriopus californicus TaxID=6832 RepID=A0A553PMA0_TIGCA|nr:hypothetical protein TCAL_07586 [Tigriopus californicus]|eukprot:TCALIF_07586-PA protein Name:"Similar to Dscam2 Down syndrome cell adhesion molecule-like protein Dscam2 (Drosophila melanogaster)" AED:0.59 eAED:0.59 QI:0/0.66/0.25/0.75/0.66/0.75/4/0/190
MFDKPPLYDNKRSSPLKRHVEKQRYFDSSEYRIVSVLVMRTLAVLWTPFAMGILLLFAHLLQVSAQSDTSGPVFIQEPPNQMDFSNTTGTEIICQSRGTPMPQITWVKTDGSIVQDVPGLRKVLSNGNLVLPPFRAEDYNQEVHAQTYRCIAENSLGKIQSRDVQVRAGTDRTLLQHLSGNSMLFLTTRE